MQIKKDHSFSSDNFVPENVSDFYSNLDKKLLVKGDILESRVLGLKVEGSEFSPDYWMIITKNCDLVLTMTHGNLVTRKGNISIIPIFKMAILSLLNKKYLSNFVKMVHKKIVIVPLIKIFDNPAIKKNNIDNIINDKITKFNFLPPDGRCLLTPHIIDFDLVNQLDGSEPEILKQIFDSKRLQLSSPFREKIAQRFAYHYSSIGINDNVIKSKSYLRMLKEHLQ